MVLDRLFLWIFTLAVLAGTAGKTLRLKIQNSIMLSFFMLDQMISFFFFLLLFVFALIIKRDDFIDITDKNII